MKVLVIEDEKTVADAIRKGLELHRMVVDVAYDGQSGLDFALSESYQLVVTDWMLPDISGVAICQRMRNEGISTPVLLLTARSAVSDRVTGLNIGADDYLIKPFAFEELLARIKALTRRPVALDQSQHQMGSLLILPATFTVKRLGDSIHLSKKEFALLEFFVKHQNQVLSADQIREQVWPFDSDILTNTVQVYIGYLRTKIDRAFPGEPPLIHTVRGFGYSFGEEEHV